MAINKLYLGLAAAAFYLFAGDKKTKASSSTTPGNGNQPPADKPEDKPADKPLPNVNDDPQDEKPVETPKPSETGNDFPDVLDDDEPIAENNLPLSKDAPPPQGNVVFNPNLDAYYVRWFRTGNENPADPDPKKLWISGSCQSWGIGKEWKPVLPAKYVFSEFDMTKFQLDAEELVTPAEYWDLVGNETNPSPAYYYHFGGDLDFFTWTRNLLTLYTIYSPCKEIAIPKRENYSSFAAYEAAQVSFYKTPFGKLFETIAGMVRHEMVEWWEENYPEEAKLGTYEQCALWAVRKYPKYSATEQTDQAYKQCFSKDPNAPKKINPKLPSHKPYQVAWVHINQYVKGIRQLIKTYG